MLCKIGTKGEREKKPSGHGPSLPSPPPHSSEGTTYKNKNSYSFLVCFLYSHSFDVNQRHKEKRKQEETRRLLYDESNCVITKIPSFLASLID